MTNYRVDRRHYVDRNEVLEADCHTKVTDVFQQMSGRSRAGIIVCENGKPVQHVNAHQLAESYLAAVRKDDAVCDLDLRAFLELPQGEQHPVEQIEVSRQIADTRTAAKGKLLDLGTPRINRIVFRVIEDGKLIGYLYSHESFKTETDTQPPKFECNGPVKHVNNDPDSGTCYSCPWPVGKASQ
jgi:hypothetical protein